VAALARREVTPGVQRQTGHAPARSAIVLAALVAAAFHLATAGRWGYFRDELYYLANADHLGLGYVEHPPLIGWLTAAFRAVLGDSLVAIRVLPALCAGGTVALAMATAAELGGRRRAQVLAGALVFVLPHFVATFGFLSMNATDNLFWAACLWLFARLLRTGDERLWLALGAAAGVGLLNKISVLFLGFGVAAGLVAARRWQSLRSPWLWLGGALACALALPYVLWLWRHDWPLLEFMANAREHKNVDYGPFGYLAAQVMQVLGPTLPIAVLLGVAWLLGSARARPFRALGWCFLAILALMLAMSGAKPYYLAPLYTVTLAAGAVALDAWLGDRRGDRLAFAGAAILLVAPGLALMPLAKPLLGLDAFLRYQGAIGLRPESSERHAESVLPQHFADRFGWEQLADDVAAVYHGLSEEERRGTCIFAQNYGQAGALDLFGPERGLPPAISGHNSYWLWGPRDCGENGMLIVIGDTREGLERWFESVELAAVHRCAPCMPYEDEKPIWIGRGAKVSLREQWDAVKTYI
jgi:hypothetical protein